MNTLLENKLIYQYIVALDIWNALKKESMEKQLTADKLFEESSTSLSSIMTDERNLQQQQFVSKEQILKDIAAQRNREIQKLKNDMEEVNKLSCATAKLISVTGERIGEAQKLIELTEEETEQAVQQLANAAREQTQQWKMTAIAMGVFVGGSLGLVLGPLGLLIGSASGGTVGAYVGDKLGEFQRDTIDKEMMEHELREKWVPDEKAVHCRQCKRLFSPFRRKHHCRKCGGVFCYLCSGQQLPIKYTNMEREQSQRVCDPCFQEFWS